MAFIRKILFVICALLILYGTWLMIGLSVPYFAFDRYTDFLMTKQLVYHVKTWRFSFYIHVFISSFVLLLGLPQFSKSVLRNYPQLHRTSGKGYAFIVLFASGPAGLIMSIYANGGIWGRISFVILSLLWLLFTALGWRYALKRNWEQHIAMMTRSYALALSALTLRFYVLLIGVFNIGIKPFAAYVLVAWISWIFNLLIAELLIRRKTFSYLSI